MNQNKAPNRDYTELAVLLFCVLLQYYFFSRRFVSREAIMSGDTQLLWSLEYLALYSIKVFNEFPWWDPTGLNGWPAHFYLLSAVNYLNPAQLISLVSFKTLSLVTDLDINAWLIFQKTTYYFTLNLLGVYLIAREIIVSRLARFFVLITFTLCEIQFHGFRDAYMFAAMPTALFFLYAFIRFSNQQNPRNLILLTFLAAVFLSSLCYAVALASLYWVFFFIFFFLLLHPSLISSSIGVLQHVGKMPQGRVLITIGAVLLLSALVAALMPVIVDGHNFIRVAGSHPIRYDVVTDFPPPAFGSLQHEIWSILMTWMPFYDVDASRLKFDPWGAGIDHRYIGLATLPLILTALVCRLRDKLVATFFLTTFICLGVLIYTYKNLAFRGLMEQFVFFQNVRTMPGLLPRDGPSLFMIFLAGIGLDLLLQRSGGGDLMNLVVRRILFSGLSVLLVISILCLLLLFLPEFKDIRHSLSHIGVYLGLYSLICVLLLVAKGKSGKRVLGTTLLIVVLADLTLSSSFYWDRGIVWTEAGAVPQHRMPTPTIIGPITNESQHWAGTYRGVFHNIYTSAPFIGKREWLVFALNPRMAPMLENWNPSRRKMTAYPYLQFFTGGTYLPFDSIKEIDKVPALVANNGELAVQDRREILRINAKEYPVQAGLAGFVESVENFPLLVRFSGWAIDEGVLQPAQSVVIFIGGRLWAQATPSDSRPDIAVLNQGYLESGFEAIANTLGAVVQPKDRVGVRAFAIMKNGTARELRYSKGYPFSTVGGGVTSNRDEPAVGPVYLHDEILMRNATKDPKKIEVPWEVKDFTLNRVRVKVSMPEDGLMMFLDNYHPYWRAKLDGKELPIYRANFTFKLVQVPSGVHEIEWVFDPYPVKWAWLFFYFSLAVFVFFAWRFRGKF